MSSLFFLCKIFVKLEDAIYSFIRFRFYIFTVFEFLNFELLNFEPAALHCTATLLTLLTWLHDRVVQMKMEVR
jgi:hypothetical protein